MYLVKKTDTAVDFFGNSPRDCIDWAAATPGRLVVLLSAEDYAAASAWHNAGDYFEGAWTLLGNQVCLGADRGIDLKTPNGKAHASLVGEVTQHDAETEAPASQTLKGLQDAAERAADKARAFEKENAAQLAAEGIEGETVKKEAAK